MQPQKNQGSAKPFRNACSYLRQQVERLIF